MFEYLYAWLRDISYYLILVTAVTYVLPSNSYRKYIRFFTGLVLILMLIMPVVHLAGVEDETIENLYGEFEAEYKKKIQENVSGMDVFSDTEEVRIEVEDVVIEP